MFEQEDRGCRNMLSFFRGLMIIMYLITVEGGDGSGKGLATKVIAQVLEKEFNFPTVEVTGEPRRDHPLGRLAINSVRTKTLTGRRHLQQRVFNAKQIRKNMST